MSAISIVGGTYRERCTWPDWNRVFGSGGRAAAALSTHLDVCLHTYAVSHVVDHVEAVSTQYGFTTSISAAARAITFDYVHPLSIPVITPTPAQISSEEPIEVSGDVVLRFGMLEGSGLVEAATCIYDPQSAFSPEPFATNGSRADRLAVVGNKSEVCRLGRSKQPQVAAEALLSEGAEVVVVKNGLAGALIFDRRGASEVPAFRSARSWTIGSGDVFAAVFSMAWGVEGQSPVESAIFASRCVAAYSDSMALPVPRAEDPGFRDQVECRRVPGTIYLAGPFFSLSQRWMIEEAHRCLAELGMTVFSPLHDVGRGPAETVAPADLEGLNRCDAVFAILDGLDPGTIFEIGYARAKERPVYVLAQSVPCEDLKMISGSGCRIFDDFTTAIHHTALRT